MTVNDLRQGLRSATRSKHDEVDSLFGRLNLAVRRDYSHFLLSNYLAHRALPRSSSYSAMLENHIAETNNLLARDLKSLDVQFAGLPDLPGVKDLHGAGVQYVLAGAHFGKRLLSRRWSRSTDTMVLAAGSYLGSRSNRRLWDEFLNQTANLNWSEADRLEISESAAVTFEIFSLSFKIAENNFAEWQPAIG